jgi:hypothetical protein
MISIGPPVHHSCDPLGAGEMDQQVLVGHAVAALCWRIVAYESSKNHLILPIAFALRRQPPRFKK